MTRPAGGEGGVAKVSPVPRAPPAASVVVMVLATQRTGRDLTLFPGARTPGLAPARSAQPAWSDAGRSPPPGCTADPPPARSRSGRSGAVQPARGPGARRGPLRSRPRPAD